MAKQNNIDGMDGEEVLRHIYYKLNGIHTLLCIFLALTILGIIIALGIIK